MRHAILAVTLLIMAVAVQSQTEWSKMDSVFPGLPTSVQVFRTLSPFRGRPNIAWYLSADLNARDLRFYTDTTYRRRLTPKQFHERNSKPVAVVNGTFFAFVDSRNLNAVIRDGQLLTYNVNSAQGKIPDTPRYTYLSRGAIGISARRRADVVWLLTDSSRRYPIAFSQDPLQSSGNTAVPGTKDILRTQRKFHGSLKRAGIYKRWKMQTAIAGGPVLVQDGRVRITNNEELMFAGNAVDDLHPRTAMGYTRDNKLIILVVQGRDPGVAEGASLRDLAEMMISLGAVEALNLDGGGSSCLLVQGRETNKPSDKTGQRAVPAVFLIGHSRENRK